jgi:hypothetical protein
LVYSAAEAFSAGIVTFGAAPNFPVAVTVVFEAAAWVLDDEEPQPATAAAASRGTMRSAAARRMRTSRIWRDFAGARRPAFFGFG